MKTPLMPWLWGGFILVLALLIFRDDLHQDELHSFWVTRDIVSKGLPYFENGYEEFPSPLLLPNEMLAGQDGHIYSKYPPLFAFLCAPFYSLLGTTGLAIAAVLSFFAALWLVRALARAAGCGERSSGLATMIFGVASFAWLYGVTPRTHMPSLAAMLCALHLAIKDRTFAAGLILGAASAIRFDSILALPGIVSILLLPRPRPRPVLFLLMGVLVSLGVLSFYNYQRFSLFAPFTYGSTTSSRDMAGTYLSLAAAGALLWACLVIAVALFQAYPLKKRHACMIGGILSVVMIALAAGPLAGYWHNLILILGDLSIGMNLLPRDFAMVGMSESRRFIVDGSYQWRHAYLQSVCFAPAALFPLARRLVSRPQALQTRIGVGYFLIAGAYLWFFGLSGYRSAGLQTRYLIPTLPFAAIGTALCIRNLRPGFQASFSRLFVGLLTVIWIALPLLVSSEPSSFKAPLRPFVTTLPLLLAGGVFLGLCFVAIWPGLRIAVWHMILAALVTSAGFVNFWDFAIEQNGAEVHAREADLARMVTSRIPAQSLLLLQSNLGPHGAALRGHILLNAARLDVASFQSKSPAYKPLLESYRSRKRRIFLILREGENVAADPEFQYLASFNQGRLGLRLFEYVADKR